MSVTDLQIYLWSRRGTAPGSQGWMCNWMPHSNPPPWNTKDSPSHPDGTDERRRAPTFNRWCCRPSKSASGKTYGSAMQNLKRSEIMLATRLVRLVSSASTSRSCGAGSGACWPRTTLARWSRSSGRMTCGPIAAGAWHRTPLGIEQLTRTTPIESMKILLKVCKCKLVNIEI